MTLHPGTPEGRARAILGADVLQAAARAFQMPVSLLRSDTRTVEVVTARHAAMIACRLLTELSSAGIGRVFRRDHTTVLHALGRHAELADETACVVAEVMQPSAPPEPVLTRPALPALACQDEALTALIRAARRLEQARFSSQEGRAIDAVLRALDRLREAHHGA